MNILLIMPNAKIHAIRIKDFTMSFREAPLTMTTLAALTPDDINANIRIIDESVEKVDFEKITNVDLVGISAMTGTSIRAYQIAKIFRNKSIPVVLGGVHVSINPEEAEQHADVIVTGFAEKSWPKLLGDFKNGQMKKRYDQDCVIDLVGLPIPRRDLQKKFAYMSPNTVSFTRGCSNTCAFCTVPIFYKGYYKRPIEEVIREIHTIKSNRFVVDDVNLLEDREYSLKLLKALAPLKKIWGGLATIKIVQDKEMMYWLEKSGCRYLLVGFETFSDDSLNAITKTFNKSSNYKEAMKIFHDHGVMIQGCFIFGFDTDDKFIFEKTVERVNEIKVDIPRYAIYTPYPGTPLFKELWEQKRILTTNWSLYDTQHVVFQPKLMTPGELYQGFRMAYRETFTIKSILDRTLPSLSLGSRFPIAFLGNLAYNIYINRINKEPLPNFSGEKVDFTKEDFNFN
ncbi:MAG: B12-binding domain-containing radical SAM protein [Oligoflexia bacterium]|nr:B12-binding domain-containing radical SAM protein [Oligoflexia bacterium]